MTLVCAILRRPAMCAEIEWSIPAHSHCIVSAQELKDLDWTDATADVCLEPFPLPIESGRLERH